MGREIGGAGRGAGRRWGGIWADDGRGGYTYQDVAFVHVHARDERRRVGDERLELLLEPNLARLLRHGPSDSAACSEKCIPITFV